MAQRTYAEKGTNQISEYALAPPGPKSLTHVIILADTNSACLFYFAPCGLSMRQAEGRLTAESCPRISFAGTRTTWIGGPEGNWGGF